MGEALETFRLFKEAGVNPGTHGISGLIGRKFNFLPNEGNEIAGTISGVVFHEKQKVIVISIIPLCIDEKIATEARKISWNRETGVWKMTVNKEGASFGVLEGMFEVVFL